MMNLHACAVALFLLFGQSSASAQIYKWVDEKGVTHYGQKAPEGKATTEVKVSTPSDETLAAAKERLAKIREDLLNRDGAITKSGNINPQAPSNANQARCAELRQQLGALNSQGALAGAPPVVVNEAKTRLSRQMEAACNSAPANNPGKEADCSAALQALLGMENPQSRATASERETMRNRARASCQ